MSQFSERGVVATRIEDITNRADVAKGVLYNHFESKAALISALLERAIDVLERQHLPAPAPDSPVAERVAAIVAGHDRFFAKHPEYVMIFHQVRGLFLMPGTRDPLMLRPLERYLHELGTRLAPSGAASRFGREDRIRLGALVAGSIVGRRSFDRATGLAPRPEQVAAFVTAGVAALRPAAHGRRAENPGTE